MSKQDYYELLGVPRNADSKAISSAFRKLAKKYHPDHNPNNKAAEQKFKEINAAYEVLKNDEKRAAYDRYGENAFSSGGGGRQGFEDGGGFGGFSSQGGADFSDFADIFSSVFGDAARRGGRKKRSHTDTSVRGADLSYELTINLEDAYKGKKQNIRYRTAVKCGTCHGSGSKSGTGVVECKVCEGVGVVRKQKGFFIVEETCQTCSGIGFTIKDPCQTCSGTGRVIEQKTVQITIPQGISDGEKLRLTGEGEAGMRGGKTGDLYVSIRVEKNKFFERIGNNLKCIVPLKMTTAALGGHIEIPGIDGKIIKIKIPEGTQSMNEFRVKGKGMPILGSHNTFGDLFIVTQIEIPINLSAKQKKLLEEFEGGSNHVKNSPNSESFFNKIKKIFD